MNPKKIKIIIKDAVDFLDSSKDVYDLIIVDLYSNEGSPKQFERKSFVKKIKDHLNKEGIVIFNRLRKTKDNESLSFARKLEKIFKKVEYIYPRVNLHMICYTQ
jgi:spermidine synthase